MKLLKWSTALVVALLLLAGCGSEDTPRTVTIALDHTTVRESDKLAADWAADAAEIADPVLVEGGHLRVVVFGGAGVAPAVLIDEDIPTASQMTGNKRKRFVIGARRSLKTLLNQALGLESVPADSPLARQLDAMAGGGSDIAGGVSQEVDLLQQRGGGTLHVRSDGLQRSGGIDFSKTIGRADAAESVEALSGLLPKDARGVAIVIAGLGITGGDVTTERAQKLVEVWGSACKATKADACTAKTAVA